MQAFATACAGYLLAVLWFDLMHDVAWRTDLDGAVRYLDRSNPVLGGNFLS
jgi:hypothetical protein